ncbi:cupin domain-containing protein [Allosphingosinicella deserti]|uniref:cupin domain-containing protein n=1 Tax=Allosphingosinicella deserti TaxID=2116704 RepID=UPI000D6305DB|nr:cupin domain-containing protein [Sphingomonas deserti]
MRQVFERQTIKRWRSIPLALATIGVPAAAQEADPTAFAGAAEVQAQIADMEKAMKPDQGFSWRPLVRNGETVAALEIWKKAGRPAVHPTEAEYAIVIAGQGTLVSGGTLVDAKVSRPGLTEGSRIEGGTTRGLKPGDVMLIPAGTPHWFGITDDRLVLLGTKVPVAAGAPR